MLSSVKQRLDREDEGFTLIELMVVVLIIAILLAIAIPTFLGARGQANSRAAQSSLRNALTAEQTYYTNNQVFGDTTTTPSISSIEPNLNWQTATESAKPAPNTINVVVATTTTTGDSVYLQTYAKDGNCYTVFQSNGQVPAGNFGTGYEITSGACTPPSTAAYPTVASGNAVAGAGFYTSW